MKLFSFNGRAAALLGMTLSVVVVSVLAYWPSIDNSFISDDFTMLPFVRLFSAHPGVLLEVPSEIFRTVSYVYFWLCVKVFGPVPSFFYWSGIALHAVVSLLVGRLVFVATRSSGAAWAAALFFAVYERHQEAVMWISAVNDTLLTLFSLMFLLFWERSLSDRKRGWAYRLSLVTLLIALFCKEPSVALIPLAVLLMVLKKRSLREIYEWCTPPLLMLVGYGALWLWAANRNFFVTEGHYALSLHFFPVYFRAFWRIFSPALLFLIPLVWLAYRQLRLAEASRLLRGENVLFFVATIALTVAPYSFLTYLDHIPSRNTYLPSVGLAALVGLFLVDLYNRAATPRGRGYCVGFLAAVLAANITYIWVKKEPQFQARAAPTSELIARLNGPEFQDIGSAPVYVCGFPLHVTIGQTAVEGFTRFAAGRVAFVDDCDGSTMVNAVDWVPAENIYAMKIISVDASDKEQDDPE